MATSQTESVQKQGVGPETARLPAGWEDRLIAVSNPNTDGATGWCLEPHDLAFSKLAASREKDLAFVTELLLHKMIRPSVMDRLINEERDAAVQEKLRRGLQICTERLKKKRNE